MTNLVKRMKTKLEKWSEITGQSAIDATVLFAKMNERADTCSHYEKLLIDWLDGKSKTIELRDLTSFFGNYWTDLNHANAVDTLDAANLT